MSSTTAKSTTCDISSIYLVYQIPLAIRIYCCKPVIPCIIPIRRIECNSCDISFAVFLYLVPKVCYNFIFRYIVVEMTPTILYCSNDTFTIQYLLCSSCCIKKRLNWSIFILLIEILQFLIFHLLFHRCITVHHLCKIILATSKIKQETDHRHNL